MPTTTTHAPGTFCWPELGTTDQDGAKKFYTALFGWTFTDSDMGKGETYTMWKLGGRDVGALFKMRPDMLAQGVPPHWGSYVAVESADQTAARAKELGAKVIMDAFDVMDAGRMAVIQDPTGATFCAWEAKKHAGAGVLDEAGALCWTELVTPDTNAAARFYTALLPWKAETTNMGMPYTVFKRGDKPAAGMMQKTPEMAHVPPSWTPYFAVTDTDASVAKAQSLGGKVAVPPQNIPTVGRFAVLCDPQGAVFCILGPEKK